MVNAARKDCGTRWTLVYGSLTALLMVLGSELGGLRFAGPFLMGYARPTLLGLAGHGLWGFALGSVGDVGNHGNH